jgi:21S rRNA (GM2251-2'-O)-methyltransferase
MFIHMRFPRIATLINDNSLSNRMKNNKTTIELQSVKYRNLKSFEESYGSALHKGLAGEIIFGVSPVLSALIAGRRNFYRLLVVNSSEIKNPKNAAAINRARFLAESKGTQTFSVSRHDLNMFTGNRPHQGLALDCSPLDLVPIIQPPIHKPKQKNSTRQHAFWLALDEITDSQNLGAIARSVFFLGIDGMIVCSKNTAPINAFASKASAGALEYLVVHNVLNLPIFLVRCSENGWIILGAANSNSTIETQNHN